MEKYYLVNSFYKAYGSDWKPQMAVLKEHPFIALKRWNEMDGYETALLSYQEITQEEYNLYQISNS